MIKRLFVLLLCMVILPGVFAATATISQSGADSGTVMKSVAFTLTVDGLTGSGTVSVSPPSGFTLAEEDRVQSFSSGTTSLSFSTVVADEVMSEQTLTAQIMVAGSPSTATTSAFNVILPPSLSAEATPDEENVTGESSFDLSIDVQNTGETSAQGVTATITLPSGLTTSESTTKTIGEIDASSSSSVGWTIAVGSPSASSNVVVTIESTNTDTETITIPIVKDISSNSNPGSSGGGGGGGGGGGPSSVVSQWVHEINLTDSELNLGQVLKIMKTKYRLLFNVNGMGHSVGILNLSNTSATIEVASTPQIATLVVGESKNFDVTSDGKDDVLVRLVSIANGDASLSLQLLPQSTTQQPTEQPLTPENPSGSDNTDTPSENNNAISLNTIKIGDIWKYVVFIVLAGIIFYLISLVFKLIKASQKRKKHQSFETYY